MTLWDFLPTHLLVTAGIAGSFVLLWYVASRKASWSRVTKFLRFRVAVLAPLVTCGYFAGGFVAWMTLPTPTQKKVLGASMTGMMVGATFGVLISRFVGKYYRCEFEGDEDAR